MAENTTILNGKTEYTAVVAGVTNVGLLLAKIIWHIELGPDVVVGINGIFVALLSVFMGNRQERTKEAADEAKVTAQKVEANQPSAPAIAQAVANEVAKVK